MWRVCYTLGTNCWAAPCPAEVAIIASSEATFLQMSAGSARLSTPRCSGASECLAAPGCVRCARSGYCTDQELPKNTQ
eukprot:scaffold41839_cov71-Phaeocystis_antarctica.AAC.3